MRKRRRKCKFSRIKVGVEKTRHRPHAKNSFLLLFRRAILQFSWPARNPGNCAVAKFIQSLFFFDYSISSFFCADFFRPARNPGNRCGRLSQNTRNKFRHVNSPAFKTAREKNQRNFRRVSVGGFSKALIKFVNNHYGRKGVLIAKKSPLFSPDSRRYRYKRHVLCHPGTPLGLHGTREKGDLPAEGGLPGQDEEDTHTEPAGSERTQLPKRPRDIHFISS